MGVSPRRRKKRRGSRPVDRQHLERYCQRCGASFVNNLNAPVLDRLGLCAWCEWQWVKLEAEYVPEPEGIVKEHPIEEEA